MKYAVKLFADIDNPMAAPSGYPAVIYEIEDSVESVDGYRIMTQEQLDVVRFDNEEAYHEWTSVHCKPAYVQKLRDAVDLRTQFIIEYGFPFTFGGDPFRVRCNAEDQMNYTGLIIMKDFLPYEGPNATTLKGYDTEGDPIYTPIPGPSGVMMLYGAAVQHIKNCLDDGWKIKDTGGTLSDGVTIVEVPVAEMTCEQLAAWTDPRM